MSRDLSLTLASELTEINRAAQALVGHCRAHGLPVKLERALQLVVEELMTNTVRHGRPPAQAPVELELTLGPDTVVLEYRDRGPAFDPRVDLPPDHRDRPLEERPVGGLGWALILNYFDLEDWRYANGGNHYRLRYRQPVRARDA